MFEKWLFRFSGNLRCRRIDRDEGKRYLERYYLGKWFGYTAYLHRFVDADRDEETHDHPFTALAICLAGWYREERLTHVDLPFGPVLKDRSIRPGSFNFIRGGGLGRGDFHRIVDARPETWTLFIHGGRLSSWGFLRQMAAGVSYIHYGEVVKPITEPFNGAFLPDWWLRAPLGRDADRAAFGLAMHES
jgi:hypothetical protein